MHIAEDQQSYALWMRTVKITSAGDRLHETPESSQRPSDCDQWGHQGMLLMPTSGTKEVPRQELKCEWIKSNRTETMTDISE